MGMLGLVWNRLTGYDASAPFDALNPRGRRRQVSSRIRHEDQGLSTKRRKQLSATAQDLHRNFAVPAWAVRKHLDYVSRFSFQATTKDKGLNSDLEAMIREKSKKENCDYAARHPLRRFVRMAEARRVLDGDIGILKVEGRQGGGTPWVLQAIEQDRICNPESDAPSSFNTSSWTNGVRTRSGGRTEAYCICSRGDNGLPKFERIVDANDLYLHASFEGTHRFDQVRGVSPIVTALNSMRDVYEGFDYALAKIKLAQILGLKVTRETETDGLFNPTSGETEEDVDDEIEVSAPQDKYQINLQRGPFHLEMDPGEDLELVESKTPATETVEFLRLIIQVALKSLDIPYSFFDESFTNFYGSRGGLIQYLKSCRSKIEDNQDLLDHTTDWWFNGFVYDGELVLPRSYPTVGDLSWSWVPDGVPWWDPLKEVNGHKASVNAGFDNIQNICRMVGTDFYENVDRNAEAREYAAKAGVPLDWGAAAPAKADPSDPNDPNDPNSDDNGPISKAPQRPPIGANDGEEV